jgi:hypothetical protein
MWLIHNFQLDSAVLVPTLVGQQSRVSHQVMSFSSLEESE